MRGPFRVFVERDFMQDEVKLLVGQHRYGDGWDVLLKDGSWMRLSEGTQPPADAGIRLPEGVLEELAIALGKYLGNALPSEAEVKVLGESLKVERERVDRILSAFVATDSEPAGAEQGEEES